jgi:hypothetical protein
MKFKRMIKRQAERRQMVDADKVQMLWFMHFGDMPVKQAKCHMCADYNDCGLEESERNPWRCMVDKSKEVQIWGSS